MLKQLKKTRDEGFTIIEVMIVLAIGGLIILIVLLAVPALQRNGRNTATKNDASAIAAAVAEFKSNNEGKKPLAANSDKPATSNEVTIAAAAGAPAQARVQESVDYQEATGAGARDPSPAQIIVNFEAKCPTTTTGTSITTIGDTRGVAIVYAVEASGSNTAANTNASCIDA